VRILIPGVGSRGDVHTMRRLKPDPVPCELIERLIQTALAHRAVGFAMTELHVIIEQKLGANRRDFLAAHDRDGPKPDTCDSSSPAAKNHKPRN
jgi:hypothetical protein